MDDKFGGPAFPRPGQGAPGMTLLDYFAGQALAGEAATAGGITSGYEDVIAARCYSLAAAMLRARKRYE